MTVKQWFAATMGRRPAYNSTYNKVAVQCSVDIFVVNQSLVLRINLFGKNRHLRQARNRTQLTKQRKKISIDKKVKLITNDED